VLLGLSYFYIGLQFSIAYTVIQFFRDLLYEWGPFNLPPKHVWESASLLTALHTPLQFTYLSFSYLILSPKLFLSTKFPISSLTIFNYKITTPLSHTYF